MSRASKIAVLALASALVLTGCAGPASDAPTGDRANAASDAPTDDRATAATDESAGVAPATGDTITGTGYTYSAPEGWGVPEQEPAGFAPDTLVMNLEDSDGFGDNVNVLLSPAGAITPEQVESLGVEELETAGATDVVVGDRVTVADEESAHISSSLSNGGQSYAVEQYYPTHQDQTYVVTFSFSATVPEADRLEIAESVLASWEWS